jgi:hypothetical protein
LPSSPSPLCLPPISPCLKVLIMALLILYYKNFNSKAKLIFWNVGKKKHRHILLIRKILPMSYSGARIVLRIGWYFIIRMKREAN